MRACCISDAEGIEGELVYREYKIFFFLIYYFQLGFLEFRSVPAVVLFNVRGIAN